MSQPSSTDRGAAGIGVLDSATLPAARVDAAGGVAESNAAFARLAGVNAAGGQPLDELFEGGAELVAQQRSAENPGKIWTGWITPRAGGGGALVLCLPLSGELGFLALAPEGNASPFADYLTQLPNRQEGESRLSIEWARAARRNSDFSIALCDIDHFKTVNDRYGHEAGDQALVHMAKILMGEMRAGDWCARWGGEEFLIFLPDVGGDQSKPVLDRIRKAVSEKEFVCRGQHIPLTASFGAAPKAAVHHRYQDVVNDADILLGESKRDGRNRATVEAVTDQPVFWRRSDISGALEEHKVVPRYHRATRDDGGLAALEVVPHIEGLSSAKAARMWNSAALVNMATELEWALLEGAMTGFTRAAEAGADMLLPLSEATLASARWISMIEAALAEWRESAGQPPPAVFLLDAGARLGGKVIEHIRRLAGGGAAFALRNVAIDRIPLGFMSQVPMRYLILDEPAGAIWGEEDSQQRARTLLRGAQESWGDQGTVVIVARASEHQCLFDGAGNLERGEPLPLESALS